MQNDDGGQTAKAEAAGQRAEKRAEVTRGRFHVAAQKGAALAAGGIPSEAEASRMVAEFLAGGGRITDCAPAEDAPTGDPPPASKNDPGETP